MPSKVKKLTGKLNAAIRLVNEVCDEVAKDFDSFALRMCAKHLKRQIGADIENFKNAIAAYQIAREIKGGKVLLTEDELPEGSKSIAVCDMKKATRPTKGKVIKKEKK